MKRHITKAVALLMTLMMLVSLVPATVLAELVPSSATTQSTGEEENGFASLLAEVVKGKVSTEFSPYEPYSATADQENNPFLPYGDAWIDLSTIFYGAPATPNYPITKWSANTSVVNPTAVYNEDGSLEGYALPDLDLINEYTWHSSTADTRLSATGDYEYENGVVGIGTGKTNRTNGKSGAETAFAYNRYDAMQGKWGITIDKNVSNVSWTAPWATGQDNSRLCLVDTPFLFYSTEANDGTKMAISILIGTPVKNEISDTTTSDASDLGAAANSDTTNTYTGYYEYRWYTITDNKVRPGIDSTTETDTASMTPSVRISGIVDTMRDADNSNSFSGAGAPHNQQSSLINYGTNDERTNPFWDLADGENVEDYYVDGAITGCIDFTNLLPLVYSDPIVDDDENTPLHNGKSAVRYKIAQVRVDMMDVENDAPARINYLYFGPGIGNVYAPQNTVGADVPAESWENVLADGKLDSTSDQAVESVVANRVTGWENGMTVSVENTPSNRHEITIDTTYSGAGTPTTVDVKDANGNVVGQTYENWTYIGSDGNEYTLSTDYNSVDKKTYAMITIPVRKWFNTLADARKLSLTLTVENYGITYDAATDTGIKPTLSLWGNNAGSVGHGHSGAYYDTRFRHEEILGILGNGYYLVDLGTDYNSAEVDRTLGDSMIYNKPGETTESWFDLLRSPYMYSQLALKGSNYYGYDDKMTGYVYVSAIRVAVEVGTKLTIKNMAGDGNSAGLNMYSLEGEIVNAYDGGSGVQPVITLGERSEAPAAYGPYLAFSNYTSSDLLNYSSDDDSKRVYGQTFYNGTGSSVPLFWNPISAYWDHVTNAGFTPLATIEPGDSVVVYAIAQIYEDDPNGDGSTADAGYVQYGWTGGGAIADYWFRMYGFAWDSSDDGTTADDALVYRPTEPVDCGELSEASKNPSGYAPNTVLSMIDTTWGREANSKFWRGALIAQLAGKWIYSSFGAVSDPNRVVRVDHTDESIPNKYYAVNDNTYLTYSNGERWNQNAFYSLSSTSGVSGGSSVSVNNNVEMANQVSGGTSAITRVLEEPIQLVYGKQKQSVPMFYYDFDLGMWDAGSKLTIALLVYERPGNGTSIANQATMYYLTDDGDNDGSDLTLSKTPAALTYNANIKSYCGYISLGTVMSGENDANITARNAKGTPTATSAKVVGMSIRTEQGQQNVYRRFEILQEETDWLDQIRTDTGDQYTAKSVKVIDSFNIINDAFFHYDPETDNNPDKVQNSNKGWSGTITIGDTTYDPSETPSQEGLFEYRTSLGHLRTWVPSGTRAVVNLASDRSFNISNYKYLYYSYSMRDDGGIAVEDNDSNSGVEVVLKAVKGGQYYAYLEGDAGWTWDQDGYTAEDCTYTKSMNAALDLSTLRNDSFEAINGITLYLNNEESSPAEFYINYIYLSNVEPSELVTKSLNEVQYQYYYLMDNTGDRYSARFPVIDNPTGQVKGTNTANNRVNPIVVERGDHFYEGSYYNGFTLNVVENRGEATNATENEAIRAIWFYDDMTAKYPTWASQGDNNPGFTIQDFYTYKENNGDGTVDIHDMQWSYGRWVGSAESALNTMQIDKESNDVAGNLLRRYATENYVLLRAGITPLKYINYYDADGGQIIYEGSSSDALTNGYVHNNNNYYITSTSVFSYYQWPSHNGQPITPIKHGYIFDGWEWQEGATVKDFPTDDNRLVTWTQKQQPVEDYFKAVWVRDETVPDTQTYTVNFLDENGEVWFTRTAKWKSALTEAEAKNKLHDFEVDVPNAFQKVVNGKKQALLGWKEQGTTGDDILIPAGETFIATRDITLVPVFGDNDKLTMSVTVSDAKLYIYRNNGFDVENLVPLETLEVEVVSNGNTITYNNIPRGLMLVAIPNTSSENGVWQVPFSTAVEDTDTRWAKTAEQVNSAKYMEGIVGINPDYYFFSAYTNMQLNYTDLLSGKSKTMNGDDVLVTTTPFTEINNRTMKFFTQYSLPESTEGAQYEFVAAGTLYTKNGGTAYDAIKNDLDTNMRLLETNLAGQITTANTSAVRQVKNKLASTTNQFYLEVTIGNNAATYYMRGYVIYKYNNEYRAAYSDIIASAALPAVA